MIDMMNGNTGTERRLSRRGLLAPADEVPANALAMGLSAGCCISTALVLAAAIGDLVAGASFITAGVCMGCVAAGLGTGVLQQVFFNPRVLGPGLPYPARTALFGLCDLAVIAGSAWFGGWVPRDMPGAWITFVVAYLAILALLTIALGRVYRGQEARYAEGLAAYRSRRSRG